MAGEWEQTTLGAEVNLLTGFPFKSECYTDSGESIPLVRGDNIAQGRMRWDGVKKWPLSDRHNHEIYELREDDVVLAMDRPWIEAGLKYAAISKHDLPCLLVQRTARLRGGPRLCTRFLRYLIGSREFTQHIHAITTGTAVPHISGGQIKDFAFLLPPLAEQKAIAAVLGALDDKIELNRRMNATLEAMARALFQSWFVDFDPVRAKLDGRSSFGLDITTAALFPANFVHTDIGYIPAGWGVRSLDKTANYLNGLALQKFPPGDGPTLPVVKIAQLRKGDTSEADLCNSTLPSEYIVRDGDVLFSWSGSLEVELWCGGDGALNQHLFKVSSSEFPKWFYYLWTLHHLDEFRLIAAAKATTMGHIQRGHLIAAKALIPPHDLLGVMTRIMAPFIDQIIANRIQSRTLAALRDTLLPKLLSGELRVPELDAHAQMSLDGKGRRVEKLNPEWVVLVEVVRELGRQPYAAPVGRVIFQKIAYVLTEMGVETGFRFGKGSYGPFADEVKVALHELANRNWVREQQLGKMTALRVALGYEQDRDKYAEVIERHAKRITKTVDLFSRIKNTDQAEEVLTVLFASRELKKANPGAEVAEQQLYEYILEWKKLWRVEEKKQAIAEAIRNLVVLGWMRLKFSDSLPDTL